MWGLGSLPAAILMHLKRSPGSGEFDTGAAGRIRWRHSRSGGVITKRAQVNRSGLRASPVSSWAAARFATTSHLNPTVQFRPVEYTHSAPVLASIRNFVAVNSALEVDLSGQINSEVSRRTVCGGRRGAGDFCRCTVFGRRASDCGMPSLVGSGERIQRIGAQLSGPGEYVQK